MPGPINNVRTLRLVLTAVLGLFVTATNDASAQNPFPITPGIAVGTRLGVIPNSGQANVHPASNGIVVLLMDVTSPVGMRNYSLWQDQPAGSLRRYSSPNWTSEKLGQVFGTALGDPASSDVFVSATAIYGGDATQPGYFFPKDKSSPPKDIKGAVWRLNPMGGLGEGGAADYELVASLPASDASLGSVAYNTKAHVLYASNFLDGKIYALIAPGNNSVPYTANQTTWLDTYPSSPPVYLRSSDTDGSADLGYPFGIAENQIAAYGSRIWGLAYNPHEDRLYYALVNVDYRNRGKNNSLSSNKKQNEIWSVALDGMGKFVAGSSRLELTVPLYPNLGFSFAVSDIAFANDASTMAIAERGELLGHIPHVKGDLFTGAHTSRIMTYALKTTGKSREWVSTDPPGGWGTFNGEFNMHANSSGGVDFADGYSSALADSELFLWSTMNSYNSGAFVSNGTASFVPIIYGAQGMLFSDAKVRVEPPLVAATATTPASPTLASRPNFAADSPKVFFVDYDRNVRAVAKNQIGAIKVRRRPPMAPITSTCASVESYGVKDRTLTARICTPTPNVSDVRVVQGDLILTPTSIRPPLPVWGASPYCVDVGAQLTGPSTRVHFELESQPSAETLRAQGCRTAAVTVKLPGGVAAEAEAPVRPPR